MPSSADIAGWQREIARQALDSARWSARTLQLTQLAADNASDAMVPMMGEFIHWIRFTTRHPELVRPQQLSDLVQQFARLATNLGRGDEPLADGLAALDQAIALQHTVGGVVVDLYLAKATLLRGEFNESPMRLEALNAAVEAAGHGTEAWARAMLARSTYEIEISRYTAAIRTLLELRKGMPGQLGDSPFECAALTNEGIALFISFQNLPLAQQRFEAACAFGASATIDSETGHWVAMAHHYLARIAEVRGQYRTSLLLYLKSQELASAAREDLSAEAFLHVRIAEPLLATERLEHARAHLDQAYLLAKACRNNGTLRVQVDLTYATLAAATGKPADALATVLAARQRSREMGFWRAELLCEGYLLGLSLRQKALWRVPALLVRIIGSLFSGELRRNNPVLLVLRSPTVLAMVLRRMWLRRMNRIAADETITACPCPLHGAQAESSQLPKRRTRAS